MKYKDNKKSKRKGSLGIKLNSSLQMEKQGLRFNVEFPKLPDAELM